MPTETITWYSVDDRLPEFRPFSTTTECLVKYSIAPYVPSSDAGVTCMYWTYNPYAKTEQGRAPRWEWHGRRSPWAVQYWAYMPTGKGL